MTTVGGRTHEVSEDCWCDPVCEPVERLDGSLSWLYRHRGPGEVSAAYAEACGAARLVLACAPTPQTGFVIPPDAL